MVSCNHDPARGQQTRGSERGGRGHGARHRLLAGVGAALRELNSPRRSAGPHLPPHGGRAARGAVRSLRATALSGRRPAAFHPNASPRRNTSQRKPRSGRSIARSPSSAHAGGGPRSPPTSSTSSPTTRHRLADQSQGDPTHSAGDDADDPEGPLALAVGDTQALLPPHSRAWKTTNQPQLA